MPLKYVLAIPFALACLLGAAPALADHDSFEFLRKDFANGQSWGLELGFGGGWTAATADTAYTRTLENFGYSRDKLSRFRFSFAVEKILYRNFSVLLQNSTLIQLFLKPIYHCQALEPR